MYDMAKQLRREILNDSSRKAEGTMRKIRNLKTKRTQLPSIQDLPLAGIENRRLVEKADALFDVIRDQAQVIVEWRAKVRILMREGLAPSTLQAFPIKTL